jgi:hypothetical protein
MSTFVATPILNPLSGTFVWPAAHGLAYDSFTGDLFLMGDSTITQFDPITGTIVGQRVFAGLNFDQGTVDGKGHLFVADNGGNLLFMDYGLTGDIDDLSNPVVIRFLASALDDVAPLSGPGSRVPEPGTLALLGLGAIAAIRRRKQDR